MEALFAGIMDALIPMNVLLVGVGVFLGIFFGAIPGLNAPMAIAIAVPITYYMSPLAGISFLIGINKGGTFGGSIAAILLNTPGSPEAASTAFDGYPLARAGKGLKALKMALYSSVFGDTFSDIVLFLVVAPLAVVALKMGPPEMTAVFIFSFTVIAGLTGKSAIRGLIAAVLGALLSTVGLDIETSEPRLTFGFVELNDGIPLLPMTIGMLALSEILIQMQNHILRKQGQGGSIDVFGRQIPKEDKIVSRAEFAGVLPTIFRSSIIGTAIGAVPGIGAVVAGFLGYAAAKRASKTPEKFGRGHLEGVAAAEAANSAVTGANLIPLLSLGIPGSLSAAILIGAFLIHGVDPGPQIFNEHPRLVYGIFAAMFIANILNLLIGNIGLRFFAMIVRFPNSLIHPIIVILCIVGAYATGNSMFLACLPSQTRLRKFPRHSKPLSFWCLKQR